MKKTHSLMTILLATIIFLYSCGPNNDKGSTDEKSTLKGGEVDSTKIPNFDSAHASLAIHYFNAPAI